MKNAILYILCGAACGAGITSIAMYDYGGSLTMSVVITAISMTYLLLFIAANYEQWERKGSK